MRNYKLDGEENRIKPMILVKNASGEMTVNGRSLEQRLCDYRRKYGVEEYRKMLEKVKEEDGVDLEEETKTGQDNSSGCR